MSEIRFEWDPRKARSNEKKHGISFEEAETVFYDEQALLLEDTRPANDEERFVLLGLSAVARVLVVVHAVPEDDVIRIISARRATQKEKDQYQSRLR